MYDFVCEPEIGLGVEKVKTGIANLGLRFQLIQCTLVWQVLGTFRL